MKQASLNFGFEARYFQLDEIGKSTKNLIFVLHGHGQLAEYFLRKFSVLDDGSNCIVAPEGLSRYYLEGFSGRVGATWMTKEDRLRDIRNYLSYLNSLYDQFRPKLQANTKVTVLGFSQGAATASRWVASEAMEFDQLILWAGIFPPDMDFRFASGKFHSKTIKYVYGIHDPFLTADKLEEMRVLSDRLHVSPEVISFDGVHEIEEKILIQLF